jgi:hypothetical protein
MGWVGLMTSALHHDTLLRSDGSIEVIYGSYNNICQYKIISINIK